MTQLVSVQKVGSSLYVGLKKPICKKFGLKRGDILLLEEVEIEANVLGNSFTARIGQDINANCILLKKNNIKFI